MHCYVSDVKPIYVTDNRGYKADFFRPVTVFYLAYTCFQICTFYNVARSDNCRVNNTQILSVTLFQFISRILVEDFVVGTCNSCMFLVFHDFEMKYTSAGV